MADFILLYISLIPVASEFEEIGVAIGTIFGIGFILTLWFIPTVILGIIALITKPEKISTSFKEKFTLHPDCGKYYTGSPEYCPNCGKKITTVQVVV